MRLVKVEIDNPQVTTVNKAIKKDGVNGIITFGENNDYPQIIERLVNNSISAKSIFDIYTKFLVGSGFSDKSINKIVVGTDNFGRKITALQLLRDVAGSIAMYNGAYVHINYTADLQKKDYKIIPFKNCRLAKKDDNGYNAKICVYDNWGAGKPDLKKVKDYNIFDDNELKLAAQIGQPEDIVSYKGQIYFAFMDRQFVYPLSPFDSVHMDTDTEFQIQLYKNRIIRNGFFDKTVMRTSFPIDENDREDMEKGIKSFLGADGENFMILEDEIDPTTGEIKQSGDFKFDSIKTNIQADLFQNWEKSLMNNIRKACKGLPSVLIDYDESKLGTTSGESLIQAVNYYNAMTKDDRQFISDMFAEIFKNTSIFELNNKSDFSIEPLKLIDEVAPIQAKY